VSALELPLADLDRLKRRTLPLAENRPAVYRMLDPTGRVIYVGKAKRLRARLNSYFAPGSEDRQVRILEMTDRIEWEYQPSEFAAHLGELRLIQRFHPWFNIHMNRIRRVAFVKVAEGPAPKIYAGRWTEGRKESLYGPIYAAGRLSEAVRVLNDLLGLRDCALSMPMVFAEQEDLFAGGRRAACMRYDFGTCTGPCAGLVTEQEYRRRVNVALAFLEGQAIAPLDRVVAAMSDASEANQFEAATRWRDRFEALEWLLAALTRTRTAIETLSFVYHCPGAFGDDRSYVIRRAQVRATAPTPHTPIEREAFDAMVREEMSRNERPGHYLPLDGVDEMLLLMSWFRRHPGALKRTEPLNATLEREHHPGRT
jgi:excinuclease ABC subunit C